MILNTAFNAFTFTVGWQHYLMIGLYFLVLLGIGVYAYKTSTSNLNEYMLGGRNLGPWITALSAGASDMSGWMLMGLPGEMYSSGLSAIWIAVGLTIGAYVNYIIVAPKLRVYSEVSEDSITLPDFFENRFKDKKHLLRIIAGLVIVIFFAVYTASGMVSGGKLFQSAFDFPYHWGLFITAAVVVIYTFVGGYLAVSMTDVFQGTIMFIAIVMVPVVTWLTLTGNGIEPIVRLDQLSEINNIDYLSLIGGVSLITIISNLAWGFGYFGQPHIIIRFMSISSHKLLPKARRIGITWMAVSLAGVTFAGLLGVVYIDSSQHNVADPETILILLSQVLFHPLVGGFFLAAILAAIMSTISSQLLVTSSSLVQDFYKIIRNKVKGGKENKTEAELDKLYVGMGRLSVILVSVVAIIIAWDENSVILDIVANAWAGFGAAFGPLVVMALHWKGITRSGAIAAIVGGAGTVIIWIAAGTFGTGLYEIIPGVIVSTLAGIIVSKMTKNELKPEMVAEFDETERILREEK